MAEPRSWRDLRADFIQDAERGRRLHAYITGTVEELVAELQQLRDEAAREHPNDVEVTTRDAIERVSAAVYEAKAADWSGHWTLSGPPTPIKEEERVRLRGRFLSLAEAAAKRAGIIDPRATQEQAVQVWLHYMRSRNSPYFDGEHTMKDLFEASADLVLQLYAEEPGKRHDLPAQAFGPPLDDAEAIPASPNTGDAPTVPSIPDDSAALARALPIAADPASKEVDRREETPATPAAPADLIAPNQHALRRTERERVIARVDELEWTATRWALEAGVGPAVVINYLCGKTKNLQLVKRDRLTKALNDALEAKGLPPVVLP